MGWRGVTWHTFPPSVTKKTVHLGFFRQVSQSSRDPQSSPEQIASGQGGNLVFLFKFENPPPPQKKKSIYLLIFWDRKCVVFVPEFTSLLLEESGQRIHRLRTTHHSSFLPEPILFFPSFLLIDVRTSFITQRSPGYSSQSRGLWVMNDQSNIQTEISTLYIYYTHNVCIYI